MLTHNFVVFLNHCSINDVNDPSIKYLELLEGSFVWEARTLYIVVVGVTAALIYEPVGLAIGGLGVLVVMVMVRSTHLFAFHRQIKIQSIQFCPNLEFHYFCCYSYHLPQAPRDQDTATITQPCFFLRANFSLIGPGHGFFFRGDRAVSPTHLQNLG
jgi:hypothetical protein